MNDLQMLGYRVVDAVTGFRGVVTSVAFDLYGCVQAVVTPSADAATGKQEDSRWFDMKRLKAVEAQRVMAMPDFSSPPGPENKPLP
jgi:hypothetical protein